MKKIIFGLIATAFMSFNINAQDITKSISIDLGLGRVSTYAGGCEKASGACATGSTRPVDLTVAYAGISTTAQGRVAIQMNELYYRNISAGIIDGCIVVGQEFSFPKDLLDAIGIRNEYKVKPGNYKATVSNGIYTIIF